MGMDVPHIICSDLTYYNDGPANNDTAFKALAKKLDDAKSDTLTVGNLKIERSSTFLGLGNTYITISSQEQTNSLQEPQVNALFRLAETFRFFGSNTYQTMANPSPCFGDPKELCWNTFFDIEPKMEYSSFYTIPGSLDVLLTLLDYRKLNTVEMCCGSGPCIYYPKLKG